MCGNVEFISIVEQDISLFNTRNFIFPSIHVYLDFSNDIFTRKNIVFLRVLKYDFSQWPKTLYHTDVYEIN